MVNRRQELLADVHASTDDHARLVFADFLEDEGDHDRALLIRRQCELAALPAWDRRATEARWEVERLLAEHGDAWRAALPELAGVTWLEFERGFITTAQVETPAALYEHAEAIRIANPAITTIAIAKFAEVEAPAPPGNLSWLRRIRLDGSSDLEARPQETLLDQVEELELRDIEGWAAQYLFVPHRDVVPLRRLVVRDEHALGGPIATWLATTPRAKHLRELRIGTSWIDHDTGYYSDPTLRFAGATALASCGLAELELLEVGRQRVSSPGLAAILSTAPEVRELDASACELTTFDALALPGAALVRLDLSLNAIRDDGMPAILASPRVTALESLRLDTCELGAGAIVALIESPCWQTLRVLDLSRNPLGVAGAAALAASARPAQLHTLKVANCDLDDGAAHLLGAIEWLDQLVVVDLAANTVATELVAALAGVRALDLAGTVLVGERERRFAGIWQRAVELDLAGLSLGGILADAAPALQRLSLAGCSVAVPQIEQLLSPSFPVLQRLNLAGCDLQHDELIALLAQQPRTSVRELDLRRMAWTPDQLLQLARAKPPWISLKLNGEPWNYPDELGEELERLLGDNWQWHPDDPRDY